MKSKNDWAACVHASSGSYNITISSFSVKNSNRGIEVEDGASGIIARNGYLENITNFNNSGHQAFSLDAHVHEGKDRVSDILYENIYMKNSNAPTAIISSTDGVYSRDDLPNNITYKNITLMNPLSSWQVNGKNLRILNSEITNSTKDVFIIGKKSMNVLLQNVTAHAIHGESKYIFSPSEATDMHNVTIINNSITSSPDNTGPLIFLHEVDELTLRDNRIYNTANTIHPMNVSAVKHLSACENLIQYVNRTKEIWENPC